MMRRLLPLPSLVLMGSLCCLPDRVAAQTGAVPSRAIAAAVPMHPDPRHVFVLDSAHLMSDAGLRAIQDSAKALQAETGADVAFVTLPTLHGGATDEAARVIGRRWGVGSAGAPGDPTRNRGLVILYVPDKASVSGPNLRVEVGRGLEGAITDGGGARAILEAMKPPLRAKHYDDGFVAAFTTAAALIRADAPQSHAAAPRQPAHVVPADDDAWRRPVLAALVALVAVVLLYMLYARRGNANGDDEHPVMVFPPADDDSDDSSRSSRSQSSDPVWSGLPSMGSGSSDSSSSSSVDTSSGGDFGGGGGFSGGGAGDSV